jgi:N-glycosylase/DNA lyase
MIIQSKNFSLKQIAESGQLFRMKQIENNKYGLIAYEKYLELTQLDECTIELTCSSKEYEEIWKDYFDIDFDYGMVVEKLRNGDDNFLKAAAEYGSGLRILRQEPFEVLISFIISQNKNIPGITSCVRKLCERFGERKEYIDSSGNIIVYYTFPRPEALAKASKEEIRKSGLGYRDEYVIKAANAVLQKDIDLEELKKSKNRDAVEKLKSLHGVGDKVANCVALYGLHHIDAFPIDLWISRVLKDVYDNDFDLGKYKGYEGIVQQYMFFYIRNMAKEKTG